MSETTRAFFEEFRATLRKMDVSLNELSRSTKIPRKRIARLFSGGIPRESELRSMSNVMSRGWEPASDDTTQDDETQL